MVKVLVGLLLIAGANTDEAQLKLRPTEPGVGRNFSSAADPVVGRNFSSAEPPQQKMSTFHVVLLKKGTATLDAKSKPTMDAHRAYVTKLGREGSLAAAGPFTTPGDVLGISIFRVATMERAKELVTEDPAVKAGLFAPEFLTLMAMDVFQPWSEPFAQETLYFGFLNSGPNRGQDKETAQRLQKEHIGYMEARGKENRLLAAGPFADGGTRRGIVVYRMPSLAAAKEIAEGDPMIKVGRLAVELYEWKAPSGALK